MNKVKILISFYCNNKHLPEHKIDNVVPGAYVPLTVEGNLVVDGILASCYASCHHDLVHIAAVPVQWFPEVIEWLFGDDNKFLAYVNILNDLGNWVLSDEMLNMF